MKLISSICFVLLFSCFTNAQTERAKIDSLIAYLESDQVAIDDFEQIKRTCTEVEELSEKIDYIEGIFIANLILAQVYRDFSFEEVNQYISKLDEIFENQNDLIAPDRVVTYLLVKGYTTGFHGNFSEELECYLIADSIVTATKLTEYEVFIDQHIANFYSANEEYDKALVMLKKIVKEANASPNKEDYSYPLSKANLGIGFINLKQYDSAIYYTHEAINSGLGRFSDLHYQYLTIADAYLQLNKLDSAKRYLNITQDLYTENYIYSIDLVNYNITYGDYYNKLEDYPKAITHYKKALADSDSLNYINGIKIVNENLLTTYLKQGNHVELLTHFEAYKSARDSITERTNLKIEKEHLVQFESLKKETEIKELKLLRKIEQERQWLIVSIFALVILGLILLIYRYKSKQVKLKQKIQLESLEKEKAKQKVNGLEKELTLKIDHLHANSKIIEELKKASRTEEDINEMIKSFNQSYIDDTEWRKIILQFENIHENFVSELKHSADTISNNDLKLAILTKLSYSNTDMAEVLNISIHGVKKAKQRLKNKLEEQNASHILF